MNMSTPIPMEELDLDSFKLFEKFSFHNCDKLYMKHQGNCIGKN